MSAALDDLAVELDELDELEARLTRLRDTLVAARAQESEPGDA